MLYHHHAKSIGRNTSDPRIALEAAVREYSEMESVLRTWMPVLRRDPALTAIYPCVDAGWRLSGSVVCLGTRIYRKKAGVGHACSWRQRGVSIKSAAVGTPGKGRLDGEIHQPTHGVLSIIEMARHAPDTLLLHTGINDGIYDALAAYREFIPEMRVVLGSTI